MLNLLLLCALASQDSGLEGVRLLTPDARTREKIELALPLAPSNLENAVEVLTAKGKDEVLTYSRRKSAAAGTS